MRSVETDSSAPLRIDMTDAVGIVVFPGVQNDVFFVCPIQSIAEQRQQSGEIDGTLRFVQHRFQFGVLRRFAQRGVNFFQIIQTDSSISILIHQIKRLTRRKNDAFSSDDDLLSTRYFFEFLNLFLIEHGENIARCALSFFLQFFLNGRDEGDGRCFASENDLRPS